jgi:hypothetical protein
MMSACVKWAKEEVDAFNSILSRQLSGEEEGSEIWTRCLDAALEHAGTLFDVGLDFTSLVGQNLRTGTGIVAASDGQTNAPVGLGLS